MPSLLNYTGTLTEKVESFQNKFDGYVNRLQTVRDERQKAFAHYNEGNYPTGDDDLFSDTSSISSRSSIRTSTTTSKR